MEKQTGKQLLKKLKDGIISPEELKLLESWYEDYVSKMAPIDDGQTFLKDMEILDKAFPFEIEKQKTTTYKLWRRIAATAAVVAMVVSLLYFLSPNWLRHSNQKVDFIAGTADIAPAKHTATLGLANGKTIELSSAHAGLAVSEGSLRYTDGTTIDHPIGTMEPLVAKTPMGGTYQFTLPDGSRVWLNAASSITFPSSFAKGKRRVVEVTGEAYFEVAKAYNLPGGERIPFIVKSGKQELEVLGTHFNLNAYQDEPVITTTLLEGSVRVSSSGNATVDKGSILKPNQQAVFGHEGIKVFDADPDMAVAWKNGYFTFEEESIQSIMRKLAKWYDIDVSYEPGLQQQKFTGRISRSKHISQVLKLMSAGKSIRFKVEGRRVTVIR